MAVALVAPLADSGVGGSAFKPAALPLAMPLAPPLALPLVLALLLPALPPPAEAEKMRASNAAMSAAVAHE